MYLKLRFYIKIIEYLTLAFIISFGLALAILFICNSNSCRSLIPTYDQFSLIFLIFLCFFSILNSLRIWLNFNSYDFNDDHKDRFNLGLIGIAFSYILCGVFFKEINSVAAREIPISGIFIFILFTLALSFGLLLSQSDLWERSTNFTKVRLSGSTISLITILFNPFFGVILTVIVILCMILYPEKKN